MPSELEAHVFDQALILHADHELPASTFAARVIAATLSDMYSAITGAIGALKGPLHGGANQKVMEMLEEMGSVDAVEPWVLAAFARKERLMGFGHRVYKTFDPRARILKDLAADLASSTGDSKWYDMECHRRARRDGAEGSLTPTSTSTQRVCTACWASPPSCSP